MSDQDRTDEKQKTEGTQDTEGQGEQQDQQGEKLSYETWFEKQPPEIKALIEENKRGLQSALKAERETRKDLEKQVRELAEKAEKGSEVEKRLTETADKLAEMDKRLEFYDAAHKANVTNLKLAWRIVNEEQLFTRKGEPDLEALKESYPELFAKPASTPPGNSGAGTKEPPKPKVGMNEFIRAAAGRM